MAEQEEWRPVVGNPNYEVSNLGRVRRLRKRKPGGGWIERIRVLNPGLDGDGYVACYTAIDGRFPMPRVHRLVAQAFIGPCPVGHEVNHKDGDKQNNRVENLEYLTQLDNIRHAVRTGLRHPRVGEAAPTSKLSEADVRSMRSGAAATLGELAERFNVNEATIRDALGGRTWAHISPPAAEWWRARDRSPGTKLSAEQARSIRQRYRRGLGIALAKAYAVSPSLIRAIAMGTRWKSAA